MLGKDGKPFKTRTGGTVKLIDLLNEAVERAESLIAQRDNGLNEQERQEIAKEVGIGAVKYADLSKSRTTDYIFDWDTMLKFEGNTAPYLQYAYTRIKSILDKAQVDFTYNEQVLIAQPQEKLLALKLIQFETELNKLAAGAKPHWLCTYLYEVSGLFMSFYEACPILKDDVEIESKMSRLTLALLTAKVIKQGLDLLGINTLEKM
jgi:arginyl-tRNA synthetase